MTLRWTRPALRDLEALRDKDAQTEFTSDVMVGFPEETDADHAATISLIEEVGFLDCHVFRYSQRPGTPAATLERVDPAISRIRAADIDHGRRFLGAFRQYPGED